MKSIEFRTDPMFLRNQFKGDGVFEIPQLKIDEIDLEEIELIGYDKLSENKTNAIVHFFMDDYKFESVWKEPEPRTERLKAYKAVLTPDFSMYTEMPLSVKVYNTFRSRWCGAYMQAKGLKVIPTVSWGTPNTFWFCFDGIPKGSMVAVSTIGVRKEKSLFMQGYEEMMRKIKPKAVICYGEPFDEMKGTIITVDYAKTNNSTKHFVGAMDSSEIIQCSRCVKKAYGYVDSVEKGRGSAGGGNTGGYDNTKFPGWDPSKSPGENYEWRGRGDPISGKGAWVNKITGETLHPDLNHKEPYGPHWDYNYPGGGNGFRIYPDVTMIPKMYEGDVLYA